MSFLKKLKKVASKANPVKTVAKAIKKPGSLAKSVAKFGKTAGKRTIKISKVSSGIANRVAGKAGNVAKAAVRKGVNVGIKIHTAPLKFGAKAVGFGLKTAGQAVGQARKIGVGAVRTVAGGAAAGARAAFGKSKPALSVVPDEETSEEAAKDYGAEEESSDSFDEMDSSAEPSDSYVPEDSDPEVEEFMSEPAPGDHEEGDAELMDATDYAYALADAEGTGLAGVKQTLIDAGKAGGKAAAGSLLFSAADKLGVNKAMNAPAVVSKGGGLFGMSQGQTMVAGAALAVPLLFMMFRR